MKVETVLLENNKEYAIINKVLLNNKMYAYLVNINNYKDFCIRIIKSLNNGYQILRLDNEKEYMLALKELTKKNN